MKKIKKYIFYEVLDWSWHSMVNMYTYNISVVLNCMNLFKIGISSLLFIGAWGAGHSAGMLVKSYGVGESALWVVSIILSISILAFNVYWYVKKAGTVKTELRGQGILFSTMTGISVLLFLILNGSKSFNFLIAGWEIRFRLRNLTDFMVFFVAFTLVSLILSIIAWVKYNKTSATPPRTGTATP